MPPPPNTTARDSSQTTLQSFFIPGNPMTGMMSPYMQQAVLHQAAMSQQAVFSGMQQQAAQQAVLSGIQQATQQAASAQMSVTKRGRKGTQRTSGSTAKKSKKAIVQKKNNQKTKNKKRSGGSSVVEINLSESTGSESEEVDGESSIGSFLDDQDNDNETADQSGMQQAACDQERGGAHAPEKQKGKKRAHDDEQEDKQKKRKEQREIRVTSERGRGDTRRDVLSYHDKEPYFLPCGDFVTPWDKQPERHINNTGPDRGKLEQGAFGIDKHARWLNSDDEQAKFAEAFSVPYDEKYEMKALRSDVEGTPLPPRKMLSNATSKILHCLRVGHAPTELDTIEGKNYDEVFIGLQRTSRALRQEMDGGPNGGLQGCAVDVLWNIYHGDETSNISENILRLLEILTMAKQGSRGDELYHIVATDRVEWFTKGRMGLQKVQCGVRTARQYNFHEATKKGPRCAVQDIDPRLLRKLWNFRNKEHDFDDVRNNFIELSSLVHERHQTNVPEWTGQKYKEEPQTATDPNPLKIYLYKDVLPAWDSDLKQQTTVSIEAIYLIATCPANDPLVFLKSIAENNPSATTLLSGTLAHMNSVLGQPRCSWDQLFNTDRAGAADITPESRMLEGFFRYCDSQNLRNVSIGGLRMDVRDKKEMQTWKNYTEPLKAARAAHYRMVVKECLHDRANMRDAQLPVAESAKWTDFYHGHMYWRVSREQVDQEIEDYLQMWEAEDEQREVFARLRDWKNSHFSSADGASIFIPEGEGYARNSGLWIKIKTDNGKTHEEETRELAAKRSPKNEDILRWPQPQQDCRLIKIWLSNARDRASGCDPLDFILTRTKWIPDIEWMNKVLPLLDEQNDQADWLKEMIGEYVTTGCRKQHGTINTRTHEILQLVGKERNAVHKGLASVEEACRMELLWRTRMQKINASIKNALVQMHTSELVQWRLAAMDIEDLKKQNKLKERWMLDYCNFHQLETNIQDSEDWSDLLCPHALNSVFFNSSMARLNSDLCFMNQLFMWLFICCTMAHNECRRGAYGMTMRIMDMAGTVDVLKEIDFKGSTTTTVVKVTEKSPGAGADTSISFVMQMLCSSMTYISQTKEVRDMASTSRDTVHKNVSKMSYALLQGSGVLVNAKSEIVTGNTSFQIELSNNAHFTELFKNDEDAAMLGWLESLMAHSGDVQVGAESGVKQAAWTTTMLLENYNVLRLKPMPVIVLTGNRPAQGTPASAVEGGRWMCIASSAQDKDNGFYKVLLTHSEVIKTAFVGLRVLSSNTLHARALSLDEQRKKSARAVLANRQSTFDIRKDIKIITRDDVMSNMMHFLLMQWMRKDAALLLSALTHEARSSCFSMKCTYSRLECSVGQLTSGLKRDFLDKNSQYWHRNAAGPWNKVLQVSMHVYMTLSSALTSAIARTLDAWPLDLHLAFIVGIRALMTNTITFMAMLASLQLWLSCAVLDANFMILSCYIYHFSAFQSTCSLRIFSLVMLGHPLSQEDKEKYLSFCTHIAPFVLESRVLGVRTDNGPRNVPQGTMEIPSHSVLAGWYSFFLQHYQNDIRLALAARTEGREQQQLSVYCQPRLGFVHSESIKGFGQKKDSAAGVPDPNISGTSRRVLATSIARAQRLVEHQKRVEKGACFDGNTTQIVNGRQQKNKLEEHENTAEFWKNVRQGTLLPEASTSTNDIFKVKFEFTPQTGIWWDNAMLNAGLCDGVVKHFLLQSDLDLEISHFDFFTKLMGPYLEISGIQDRVYGGPQAPAAHRGAWETPVLAKLNVFEFSSHPYMDSQHQLQGVYVNVCMRLVHYVLIQGLGVTNDWGPEAHEDSRFVSCTHLRNMSHMTLGIMSLLLHTCCEKALIPPNNGRLRLPLPSPYFESNTECSVEFDKRLHVDTHLHLMGGTSDNMLSIDSRIALPSNWALINFPKGGSALLYKSVLDACPYLITATSKNIMFPFPPESVAHVSCMFKEMSLAYRRVLDQIDKDADSDVAAAENLFALAMLKLGSSVRFEDMQHIEPALTNCVVQDGREIPCVTLEHGFIFTISFCNGGLLLRPVSPSHTWERVCDLVTDGVRAFQSLPIQEEVSMPSCDFQKLFRHGIKVQQIDPDWKVVVDIKFSEEKRLPFYLFPVVHFPVLVLLQHEGWVAPVPDEHEQCSGDALLLDTSDTFYRQDCSTYHMRRIDCPIQRDWMQTNCPELVGLSNPFLSEVEAYFFSYDTAVLLGMWVRYRHHNRLVHMHFNSLQHLQAYFDKGGEPSLYHFLQPDASSYYMLKHEVWGSTPVCFVDDTASDQLRADFSYFVDKSEDERHIACLNQSLAQARLANNKGDIQNLEDQIAECRAETDSLPEQREMFRKIRFTTEFTQFEPNIMPVGEGRPETNASWGLVLENNGAFLSDGRYSVSTICEEPSGQFKSHTAKMDFISMSRCMLSEGSELWIKINLRNYELVLRAAEEQGFRLMLPVSLSLHKDMPEKHWCYLRCFYVLGGSLHDSPIETNSVTVVCAIASKRSVPGRKATAEDNATGSSRVNQNISAENTRFVAVCLPILHEDHDPVLEYSRDPDLPFYHYLKERENVLLVPATAEIT